MLYVILYTLDIFILSIYSFLYNPPCYSVYTRYCAISLLSIYNPLYCSIYIVFDIIMFSSSRSKPSVYFCNKPRRNIFLAASLYGTKMDGAKQRTVPPSAMQGKYIHRQKEGGRKAAVRELERMLRFGKVWRWGWRGGFSQLILKSLPWEHWEEWEENKPLPEQKSPSLQIRSTL